MLIRLKPCRHHGFQDKKSQEEGSKIKKLSTIDV